MEWERRDEPWAAAVTTKPLYMGHMLCKLSYWGASQPYKEKALFSLVIIRKLQQSYLYYFPMQKNKYPADGGKEGEKGERQKLRYNKRLFTRWRAPVLR